MDEAVRNRFSVSDFFQLESDEFEYDVKYEGSSKKNFVSLAAELEPLGYRPELSGEGDDCKLLVRKVVKPERRGSRIPVVFALFTLVTVIAFALLQQNLYQTLAPSFGAYPVLPTVALSLILVLGAQEVGRMYVAASRKSGDATQYLIPGIPFLPPFLPLPSLGYISVQRTPALNRDRLFDAALVGPLVLLAFSVGLYVVGDLTAVQSTVPLSTSSIANSTIQINPSVIQLGLDGVFGGSVPQSSQGLIPLSAIGNVATIGFILSFVGLLPMVPYSGGQLASLVLGQRGSIAATYLSVLALLAFDTPNYWPLAIVALVVAGRQPQQKLMDESSGLSSSRKWMFVAAVVLALLAVPIPSNLATVALG